MVNIHNLEVRFDVDGTGEEGSFARLFEQHIRRWQRDRAEAEARERRLMRERSLSGSGHGEDR